MKQQLNQFDFPFPEVDTPAGRIHIRNVTTGTGRQVYIMSYKKIRPGRNYRRKPDFMTEEEYLEKELKIPELAEAIFENNGPADPLQGDIIAGQDIFYINEGWRRWLAIGYLLNVKKLKLYPNGEPIDEVEVLINPKEYTELDRNLFIFTSQNKMHLRPMETAFAFYDIKSKSPDKISNDSLAKKAGISRQAIDGYLKLLELPADIQLKIEKREMKYTVALVEYRAKERDAKKQTPPASEKPKTVELPDNKDEPKEVIPLSGTITGQNGAIGAMNSTPGPEVKNPVIIEKDAALEAEFNARKTDKNFREVRSKSDRTDALGKIDANAQKTEAEMDLEQSIKYMDKLEIKINHLPANLKQAKEDMAGQLNYVRNLVIGATDKLKRLPSAVEPE